MDMSTWQHDPFDKTAWFVATEKVHGSNFSIITDGKQFLGAKHSAVLKPDDNMFDNHRVIETEKPRITSLFEHLAFTYKVEVVSIFGELCGGGYRNPVTRKVDSLHVKNPVQKRPWYSRDVRFYAFDIYLPERKCFLPYCEALPLLERFGFLYAKPLMVGTSKELLDKLLSPVKDAKDAKDAKRENNSDRKYIDTLKTWIPSALGLPEIEDNFIEGVVIRNIFPVGNDNKRIIRKIVTVQFRESHGSADPHKYENFDLGKEFKDKTHKELVTFMSKCMDDMCTANRMEHVYSKVGAFPTDAATAEQLQRKQLVWKQRMVGGFWVDVLKAFEELNQVGALWHHSDEPDQVLLQHQVREKAVLLCARHMIGHAKSNVVVEPTDAELWLAKLPAGVLAGLDLSNESLFSKRC
jgi:Rnl2 family RNA ligase